MSPTGLLCTNNSKRGLMGNVVIKILQSIQYRAATKIVLDTACYSGTVTQGGRGRRPHSFYAQQRIAIARICYRPSVCPSVCLSVHHTG